MCPAPKDSHPLAFPSPVALHALPPPSHPPCPSSQCSNVPPTHPPTLAFQLCSNVAPPHTRPPTLSFQLVFQMKSDCQRPPRLVTSVSSPDLTGYTSAAGRAFHGARAGIKRKQGVLGGARAFARALGVH